MSKTNDPLAALDDETTLIARELVRVTKQVATELEPERFRVFKRELVALLKKFRPAQSKGE